VEERREQLATQMTSAAEMGSESQAEPDEEEGPPGWLATVGSTLMAPMKLAFQITCPDCSEVSERAKVSR